MTPSDQPNDPVVSALTAYLAALPRGPRQEAFYSIVGNSLAGMPIEVIHNLRDSIVKEFPLDQPLVDGVLNLIDGHLSLRGLDAEAATPSPDQV